MSRRVVATRAISLLACLSLLSPWAIYADDSAASLYEEALALYHQGKLQESMIQLKNVMQKDRSFLPAQVLLGQVYIREGNGALAENELTSALRSGADRAGIIVDLGKAYLLQGKYAQVVAELSPEGLPNTLRGELLSLRGLAQMEMLDSQSAWKSLEDARVAAPKSASPLIGLAKLHMRSGQVPEAEKLADQAVNLASDSADAWNIKASVNHVLGKLAEAEQQYGKAVTLEPMNLDARLAQAGILLDLNQYDRAKAALDTIRADFPHEPRGTFLYAELMAAKGAQEAAQEAYAEVAGIIEAMKGDLTQNRGQLLLIAGVSSRQLGRAEKAREYLSRYLEVAPDNHDARLMLASVQLGLGQTDAAITLLEPTIAAHNEDYQTLTLLGTAYSRRGWHKEATEMLSKATSLSGGLPEVRTQLAFGQLGSGNIAGGVAELERVTRDAPSSESAKLALGLIYLKQGKLADATKSFEELCVRSPKNLSHLNLLGATYTQAGALDKARDTFLKAEKIDSSFLPVQLNLVKLDVAERAFSKAEERLNELLKKTPDDPSTLTEYARTKDAQGQFDEAVTLLEKVRGLSKKYIPARLYLSDLYARRGRADKAVEVAQETSTANPDDLDVLLAVAKAQIASGKPKLALVDLAQVSRRAQKDVNRLKQAAWLFAEAGDLDTGLALLETIRNQDPTDVEVLVQQTLWQIRQGKWDAAEASTNQIQTSQNQAQLADMLLGDIRMSQGRPLDALSIYRKVFDANPSTGLVLRVSQAAIAARRESEGLELLENWAAKHPKDVTAQIGLAEAYMMSSRFSSAVPIYEALANSRPADAGMHNNLAIAYHESGDKRALEVARKAYELASSDPSVNDTLGWLLVADNQASEGLAYLRTAQLRAGDQPEIHYHVAAALERLGRKDEAKREIELALGSERFFSERQAAEQLRQRLGNP